MSPKQAFLESTRPDKRAISTVPLECLDPDSATQVFSSQCPEIRLAYGEVEVRSAHLVRLKIGKRCLIRYTGFSAHAGEISWLGKIRFKGVDRRVNRIMNILRSSGFGAADACFVPRPLGTVSNWNMTLQECVPGKAIVPDGDGFVEHQAAVARALAQFHASELVLDRFHDIDAELEILADRLQQAELTAPSLKSRIDAILSACFRLASQLGDESICSIHRDFYFDQVLYCPDHRIALVDLDLACRGPAGLDVGNYTAHLHEFGIRNPILHSVCQQAEKRFLDGYFQQCSSATPQSVRTWHTLSLARHIWLSTVLEGRGHSTLPLICELEQMLENRV